MKIWGVLACALGLAAVGLLAALAIASNHVEQLQGRGPTEVNEEIEHQAKAQAKADAVPSLVPILLGATLGLTAGFAFAGLVVKRVLGRQLEAGR